MASVGSTIRGSSRSSTRTSPGACMTTPRMADAPLRCSGSRATPARRGPGGPATSSQPARSAGRESLLMGALTGHPWPLGHDAAIGIPSTTWTTEQRSASSSPLAAPASPPTRSACPTVGTRRVPGLRRSEVAAVAGLSVEYYARLERGQIAGASAGVLDALARALQLDETETRTPLRPRPRRRRHPHLGPLPASYAEQGRVTTQPALGAGGDQGRRRLRARPSPEPARHQQPRPGVLLTRASATAAGSRTWPGSSSSTPPPATSTPTGTCSPRCAWASCAPKPAGTPTTADCRTCRGALHPQRDLPPPVGRPQRPHPRHRDQALQPPRRRRAHPRLRGAGHHRRARPRPLDLHRRTRLPLRRATPAACLLGGVGAGASCHRPTLGRDRPDHEDHPELQRDRHRSR